MQKSVSYWIIICCITGLYIGTSVPVYGHFGEQSVILCTGNLHLSQAQPVILESELIFWKLTGDYVDVFVRYKLQNAGDARKVRFSLPVDYLNFSNEAILPLLGELRVRDEYNTEYPVQEMADELTTVFETRDEEYTAYRAWLTFDVSFPARAERHLTVSYRVKSLGEDLESYFSYFPDYTRRTLRYSLNSGFLTGLIKEFQLIIDARSYPRPDKESLVCNLPNYINYDGLINFTATNFDLTSLSKLELSYSNRTQKTTRLVLDFLAPAECITRITSSSSYKENYGPGKLLDGDLNSAWIEGAVDAGAGQWVEVELKNFQLRAVALVNGYTKNANTYAVNSKITRLKLELECIDQRDPGAAPVINDYLVDVARHNYTELDKQFFSGFMDVLADFGDNYVIARRIRLTILEVEPGTKYSDTGITELYLLGAPGSSIIPEAGSVQTQKI